MFAMSGDGRDDVKIPVVFLFTSEAEVLVAAIRADPSLEVSVKSSSLANQESLNSNSALLLRLDHSEGREGAE